MITINIWAFGQPHLTPTKEKLATLTHIDVELWSRRKKLKSICVDSSGNAFAFNIRLLLCFLIWIIYGETLCKSRYQETTKSTLTDLNSYL